MLTTAQWKVVALLLTDQKAYMNRGIPFVHSIAEHSLCGILGIKNQELLGVHFPRSIHSTRRVIDDFRHEYEADYYREYFR